MNKNGPENTALWYSSLHWERRAEDLIEKQCIDGMSTGNQKANYVDKFELIQGYRHSKFGKQTNMPDCQMPEICPGGWFDLFITKEQQHSPS